MANKIVMGYWDCPFCGNKEIAGNVVNCPSCGRARGEVKFYMKGVAEGEIREENERADIEYLDEEQAKYVSKNPDWYCSFCNSLNSDNAEYCSNCGASRADSESNYFEMLKKKEAREQAEAPQQAAQQPAPSRKKPLLIFAAIVIALVLFFVWFTGNKTDAEKVTGFSWERVATVERNTLVSRSGWNLPEGAELTDQKSEYHHSDQVLDHYETVQVQRSRQVVDHYETYYTYRDLGNGNFEEVPHERPVYRTEYYTEPVQQPVYVSVPRYQTKYYYNIWEWQEVRTERAGAQDQDPHWPDLNLGENEREGRKAEAYRFTVEDKKNQTIRYRLANVNQLDVWQNLKAGDAVYITAQRSGANPYLSDKDGNKIADLVREN